MLRDVESDLFDGFFLSIWKGIFFASFRGWFVALLCCVGARCVLEKLGLFLDIVDGDFESIA